jgi:hypothetical protein
MNLCRILGIALQAAVLGSALFLALLKLVAMSTGSRVFLYQGF